jgi:vacuolar-type H+-ATPase subunit I/STV1
MAADTELHDDEPVDEPEPAEMAPGVPQPAPQPQRRVTQSRETRPTSSTNRPDDRDDPEKEDLRRALKESNRKAQADRARLADLEAAEEQRQAEKLSEQERTAKQIAKLEEKGREAEAKANQAALDLRRVRIEVVVERVARDLNYIYPDLAFNLIDSTSIEVDDTGRVDRSAVKSALDKLAKDRPSLVEANRGGTPSRDVARHTNRQVVNGPGPTPESRAEEQLIQGGGINYGRF